MLKLRKNKKGFTLVELIVVIAIMAVLAGTVAGVTVSQLNKQTDNTNKTQATNLANSISSYIIGGIAMNKGGEAADKNNISQNMIDEIKENYGTLKVKYDYNNNIPKGEIGVKYTPASQTVAAYITVAYRTKSKNEEINVAYVTEFGTVLTETPSATNAPVGA